MKPYNNDQFSHYLIESTSNFCNRYGKMYGENFEPEYQAEDDDYDEFDYDDEYIDNLIDELIEEGYSEDYIYDYIMEAMSDTEKRSLPAKSRKRLGLNAPHLSKKGAPLRGGARETSIERTRELRKKRRETSSSETPEQKKRRERISQLRAGGGKKKSQPSITVPKNLSKQDKEYLAKGREFQDKAAKSKTIGDLKKQYEKSYTYSAPKSAPSVDKKKTKGRSIRSTVKSALKKIRNKLREDYETYEILVSYLIEQNYVDTIDEAFELIEKYENEIIEQILSE